MRLAALNGQWRQGFGPEVGEAVMGVGLGVVEEAEPGQVFHAQGVFNGLIGVRAVAGLRQPVAVAEGDAGGDHGA